MLSLTTTFAVGVDGFIVCVALGPQRFDAARTRLLAIAFGVCDALAMLAGSAWGRPLPIEALVPAVVGACLFLVLLFPERARMLAFFLPVPLALDNFVATFGHGTSLPFADAALTGAVSAALALTGLYLGAGLARRITRFKLARDAHGVAKPPDIRGQGFTAYNRGVPEGSIALVMR